DLDEANATAFASQEDIEYLIEDLLDGKPYEAPEPYQDLAYGLKRMQSAYLRARRQGAPDDVLDNLRTWMLDAQAMVAPPAPAAPAAPVTPPEAAKADPTPAAAPLDAPKADAAAEKPAEKPAEKEKLLSPRLAAIAKEEARIRGEREALKKESEAFRAEKDAA